MRAFTTAYGFVSWLLSNERLYLAYFWVLFAGAALLALLRMLGVVTDHVQLGSGLTAEVKRGPESTGILSAAYATVFAVVNLGVAQLVFPLLPCSISRFAFLMVTIETLAWAYLIYRWPWLSNLLIGLRF